MPVMTPSFPSGNSSYNISDSTKEVILTELEKAARITVSSKPISTLSRCQSFHRQWRTMTDGLALQRRGSRRSCNWLKLMMSKSSRACLSSDPTQWHTQSKASPTLRSQSATCTLSGCEWSVTCQSQRTRLTWTAPDSGSSTNSWSIPRSQKRAVQFAR